jgi:P27 family predicted phage terminase small subunit
MGLMGRPPKPTAIKLVQGNPGKRPLNSREPQPALGIPRCPKHLDDVARAEWRRLSKLLLGMKVLTEADYLALANLCQAYSTMVDAQTQVKKLGILYKTPSGYVMESPLLGIVKSEMAIINSLLREFGLTPSSRTRVATVAGESGTQNRWAALGRTS